MTKHFCDRCKKETPTGCLRKVSVSAFANDQILNESVVCYECVRVLYDWLVGKDKK